MASTKKKTTKGSGSAADPVESAKIYDEGESVSGEGTSYEDEYTPREIPGAKQAAEDAPEEAKEPEPEPEPPAPPPATGPKRYRVVRDTTISLGEQMVKLRADSVISEETHGPQRMRRILDAGVPLEEVTS